MSPSSAKMGSDGMTMVIVISGMSKEEIWPMDDKDEFARASLHRAKYIKRPPIEAHISSRCGC